MVVSSSAPPAESGLASSVDERVPGDIVNQYGLLQSLGKACTHCSSSIAGGRGECEVAFWSLRVTNYRRTIVCEGIRDVTVFRGPELRRDDAVYCETSPSESCMLPARHRGRSNRGGEHQRRPRKRSGMRS